MYSYIYVSRFKQKAQGRRGRQGRSPTRQQFVLPAKADIGERIVGGRPPRGSEVETALTPLGSAPFTLLSEELSRLIRTSLHYASPKHAASPPSNVFNTQPNNSSSSGGGAAEVAAAAAAAAAAVSYCSHVLVPSTIFFFIFHHCSPLSENFSKLSVSLTVSDIWSIQRRRAPLQPSQRSFPLAAARPQPLSGGR